MNLPFFRFPFLLTRAAPRQPGLGPSDSSDSGSDLPGSASEHDTDSQGTGERESVEPSLEDDTGTDIETDQIVDEGEAGVAHTRPDPIRNGGKPQ